MRNSHRFIPILTLVLLTTIAAALAGESVQKTEVYAERGGRKLSIHLHFPPDWKPTDKRAGIVFFFGGAWTKGSPSQFRHQAEHFASRGMVAARADYRLRSTDGVSPDDCVRDARSAMRWMRKHSGELGLDPDKLVASGGSAGGHLAACTMIENSVDADEDDPAIPPRPVALVLFNPVMSFDHAELKKRLGAHANLALKISPADNITDKTPPSIVFFGSEDRLLAFAETYHARAERHKVRADKWIAKGQSHGFFNREPWRSRTLVAADEFLVSLGLLAAPTGTGTPPPAGGTAPD